MRDFILDNVNLHLRLIESLRDNSLDVLERASQMIIDSLGQGGCVLLCGNGGSAADCQHIAGEFVGRFRIERKATPAVALSTDTSVITSIANDYGFDEVFRRQIEGLGRKGDVLWAFSTSGTSKNIIKAAQQAREMGMSILAFTGRPDSPLEKMSDVCLCVDSSVTSTSQEVHMLAYHIICGLVEKSLVRNSGTN